MTSYSKGPFGPPLSYGNGKYPGPRPVNVGDLDIVLLLDKSGVPVDNRPGFNQGISAAAAPWDNERAAQMRFSADHPIYRETAGPVSSPGELAAAFNKGWNAALDAMPGRK
jgi:hypothetical protein